MRTVFSSPSTLVLSATLIAGLSLVLSLFLMRLGVKDIPNKRSSHHLPVSRNGGVAVVLAFYGGVLTLCIGGGLMLSPLWLTILCLAAIMAVLGLADDLFGLSFKIRIGVQGLVALVAVYMGLRINSVTLPFVGYYELGPLGGLFSLFWLVGLVNAYNFMDGLNGLAAGVALIICLGMGLLGASPPLVFCLFWAIFGFFLLNFPQGKIFLGDAGSQCIGFILGALSLSLMIAPPSEGLFFGPLLFFAFIWDTLLTFIRRLRRNEAIFTAHREHLYQLLNRAGWSHRVVSGLHFLFALVQVGTAYAVKQEAFMLLGSLALLSGLQLFYTLMVFNLAKRRGVLS